MKHYKFERIDDWKYLRRGSVERRCCPDMRCCSGIEVRRIWRMGHRKLLDSLGRLKYKILITIYA